MKKIILFNLVIFLTALVTNAQVNIGRETAISDKGMLNLINIEENAAKSKGMMIPTVENETELPLYNTSEVDLFTDDPTMEGMVMYQKDIQRVVVYDGEKWKSMLYEKNHNKSTRLSMNASDPYRPKIACVLVGCGRNDVPFGLYNSQDDYDELGILDTSGIVNNNFNNFTIKESGFYRILVSLKVKTSGLHVTPPVISFQGIKNDYILARNDIELNEVILITAGANRTGSMEFVGMFNKGDKFKIQVSAGVAILTVADVYTVEPEDQTFINIEKLF
ncbi:hypothetical protein [Faecalibacter sp. LW9]|uniref:hypothetical protein n=1 Tax=Faecalibacter sp. LW9 TaxID=3103144 RepID=UPI002B0017EA|nr:hypothetical protein [Faecalibacter sp. LW9]